MRLLSFIMALSAGAVSAQPAVIAGTVAAENDPVVASVDTGKEQGAQATDAVLARQLDDLSREIDARLAQRLAEKAAIRLADEKLFVSTN